MDLDSAVEQLVARRRIWQEKYAIRACYRGWHRRMRPYIVPGRSLEVGAGSGDFRSFWPELITTDIVPVPWLDMVVDGMRLPLADASLSNLVVIDLLHHLADPHELLTEASRVLRTGGRILAIEPYITPVSFLAYRLMHHEDIWFRGYQKATQPAVPLAGGSGNPVVEGSGNGVSQPSAGDAPMPHKEDPWQGNLAVPNLLFGRERREWAGRHPDLRIIRASKFGFLDFQLAGGFKPYAFIGRPRLYDFFLRLDHSLDLFAWLCGFRLFVVIEKV